MLTTCVCTGDRMGVIQQIQDCNGIEMNPQMDYHGFVPVVKCNSETADQPSEGQSVSKLPGWDR